MEERKKTAITPQRLKGRWTIDYVWAFLQKRIFTFRSGYLSLKGRGTTPKRRASTVSKLFAWHRS
jgi:hypothetical protein